MEQLMLYRDTRDSIMAEDWKTLSQEGREGLLQADLKACSNLHPALYPPDPEKPEIRGHYKAGPILMLMGCPDGASVSFFVAACQVPAGMIADFKGPLHTAATGAVS
jgi:hypothetical protein